MMMFTGDSLSMGAEAGPVSPLNYKRALVRSPPREFTVEVLPPAKQGNNWSYGLKVCPIVRLKNSSDSHSMSSRSTSMSSYSEYEIWRRWEDCLDFQETLEAEYSKMSRQKVKVLRRGASGKRKEDDSPYASRNAAASFESLPEGPDPREIAVDVHDLIPQLTRKGTFFRVSRNTLLQRDAEFTAMIQALFNSSAEAPVLLQELRNCTPVRDFFGFWRRDEDIQKKCKKNDGHLFQSYQTLYSMPAITPSTCSTAPTSPTFSFRYSMGILPKSRLTSGPPRDGKSPTLSVPSSAPPMRRKFASSISLSSPSSPSLHHKDYGTDQNLPDRSILFTDELLLGDDYETISDTAQRCDSSRFSTPLSAPPWGAGSLRPYEAQMAHPPNPAVPEPIPEDDSPRPLPRPRSRSCAVPERRNARIFMPPVDSFPPEALGQPDARARTGQIARARAASPPPVNLSAQTAVPPGHPSPTSPHSASSSSRPSSSSLTHSSMSSSYSYYNQPTPQQHDSKQSRQSFDSVTSIELDFPSPIVLHIPLSEVAEGDVPHSAHHRHDSAESFASARTTSSADGVIPRCLRGGLSMHGRKQSLSLGSRGDSQTTLMEHNASSRRETQLDSREDLLDSYFSFTSNRTDTPEITMESLERELPHFIKHKAKGSISSTSSTGSYGDSQLHWFPVDDAFAVKALYRDSVVLFRADRSMTLATIRQKIRDRLALHENVPLDQDFVLAYVPSRAPVLKAGVVIRRGRSNSTASSTTDMSHLMRLETEVDWKSAVTTCGGKVTLRVLDAEGPTS